MSPADSEIIEQYDKEVTEAKQYARKLSVVILSEKAKENEEKENDKDKDKVVDKVRKKAKTLQLVLVTSF